MIHKKLIAVEGADGTGKTTFIQGLATAIGQLFAPNKVKAHVIHFRPTFLPNLGAVGEKARMMKQDTDFTNPHRAKPSGFISSFIRMSYYWLDYTIGMPVILFQNTYKSNFIIFDRYIYDFLIDPHRSRINLPYWIRKAFTKLVVQPRIVFVLLADAETIYKRKQELSMNEINRQLVEFKKLTKTHPRFVIVDACKSPEEMVNDAIQVIIERFTHKIA